MEEENIFEKICVYIEETRKVQYDYKDSDFTLLFDNDYKIEKWNLQDVPKPDLMDIGINIGKSKVENYKKNYKEREVSKNPILMLQKQLKELEKRISDLEGMVVIE